MDRDRDHRDRDPRDRDRDRDREVRDRHQRRRSGSRERPERDSTRRGEGRDRERDRRRHDSNTRSRSRSPRSNSQSKHRRKKDLHAMLAGASGNHNSEEGPMEEMTPEEQMMKSVMGFGTFHTTKGKKVEGNNQGAVHMLMKRKYRQYMNRKGGFNRPLDFVA